MKYVLIITIIAGFTSACDNGYLEEKPDQSLVIPSKPTELQALLDNDDMNQTTGLGMIGADEYYMTDEAYPTLSTESERNGYIWAKDIYGSETPYDWENLYMEVFYANVVLEGAAKLGPGPDKNYLKGQALFLRAYYYQDILQIFAKAYKAGMGVEVPGIVLKQSADVNEKIYRSSLEKCYQQVIQDTKEALNLLPTTAEYKTRASKAAAYGLLARLDLNIEEYEMAKVYADSCLLLKDDLMDYNDYDPSLSQPFEMYNDEVVFHSYLLSYGVRRKLSVGPGLRASYENNDLRGSLYFGENADGTASFKGSYGGRYLFSGLATDEMYLIKAECLARLDNVDAAMNTLNTLLRKRWKTGTYEEKMAASVGEALQIILEERKKELAFRGLRWADLRRLNRDPKFAKVLTRELYGKVYTLEPNSKRYVYPIPKDEIMLTGMEQNER